MLDPQRLHRAVDLQQRSYKLLRWMTDAIERGFITFSTAHQYATLTAAAIGWIERHYNDIPPAARPATSDLQEFANLFTTYLDNSFELVEDPGKGLQSPDHHCFCPMCSRLVDLPKLQTKKVTRADKQRGRRLRVSAVKQVALDHDRSLPDERAEAVVDELREASSRVAYGYDLFRRIDSVAEGAATLVLWRGFAWTREGSPKPGFTLRAESILEAETLIAARIDSPDR